MAAEAPEQVLVPEAAQPQPGAQPDAPSGAAAVPGVKRPQAAVRAQAPARRLERVPVVGLQLVEPRPAVAVARSGRRLSATRLFPRWRAMLATGSFVSSWPLSFPCLRGVPEMISQLPCHGTQNPLGGICGNNGHCSPRGVVGTTRQHVERHLG